MNNFLKTFFIFLLLGSFSSAFAWDDPTKGKPFFPWVWEDQLKPTLIKSVDKTGLTIIGAGAVSTLAIHQYDGKIYNYNQKHPIIFSEKDVDNLGHFGDGKIGAGIAIAQIIFDQENGIKHFKALLLSAISHATVSTLIYKRDRPDGSDTLTGSFPSGHTAAAFVAAGSLAYSYGWAAGVPAYAVASAVSISRLRGDRHWASDIVAGAFLGSFWARASFAEEDKDETAVWVPTPVDDGMMVSWVNEF